MIIYKATNIKNGKVYIGQTKKSLEWRKKKHLQDSKRMDSYFYRAIKKYGWDNFKWEILDITATTSEELNNLEKYYIKKYHSFDDKSKGYNSASGGEHNFDILPEEKEKRRLRVAGKNNPFSKQRGVFSWKGKHFSQEHKKHLSNSLKGREVPWATGQNNWNSKSIINLMTLKKYSTIKEAAKIEGISPESISRNLNGKTKYCNGCKWEFLDNIQNLKELKPLPLKVNHSHPKIYCQENKKIYKSLADVNKDFHFATKTIRECCLGIRESYKNYHFNFVLDNTVPSFDFSKKV